MADKKKPPVFTSKQKAVIREFIEDTQHLGKSVEAIIKRVGGDTDACTEQEMVLLEAYDMQCKAVAAHMGISLEEVEAELGVIYPDEIKKL